MQISSNINVSITHQGQIFDEKRDIMAIFNLHEEKAQTQN